MNERRSYFFNVFTEHAQRTTLQKLHEANEQATIIQNRAKEFEARGFKDRWRRGEISNFEYLMLLNTYSGRTFNDLSQYPVFPWTLSNYCTRDLDLNQPKNFRDLNKPIGSLDPDRFQTYLERFLSAEKQYPPDPNTYILYGTHYSNPTIVMTYLMRMEPFTTLHYNQQTQKFDHADRLFHSIQQQWDSGVTNSSDVKELIPEFFFLPDFLTNRY